jgi:tetratricopeptide (TPR) repeat protein
MKYYKDGAPYDKVLNNNMKYHNTIFYDLDLSEYEKEVLYLLGDILKEYEREDIAKTAIEEALEKEDISLINDKEELLNLGLRLDSLGRYGDAVKVYKQALRIDKFYYKALYKLWIILESWGRVNDDDRIEAEKTHKILQDIAIKKNFDLKNFDDYDVYKVNEWTKIENILDDELLDLEINQKNILNNIGVILNKWHEYDLAELIFSKLISKKYYNEEVFLNLGISLEGQEKYLEAKTAYDKAININSAFTPAIIRKNICLYKLNNFKDITNIIKALKTENLYHEKNIYEVGEILIEDEKYKEAEKIFKFLLKINKNNEFAWYYLWLSNYGRVSYHDNFAESKKIEKKAKTYFLKAEQLSKNFNDSNIEELLKLKNIFRKAAYLLRDEYALYAWSKFGFILKKLGKLDQAKDIFNIDVATYQNYFSKGGLDIERGYYVYNKRKLG